MQGWGVWSGVINIWKQKSMLISFEYIFCHSQAWLGCHPVKKNKWAADVSFHIINIAGWCEGFKFSRMDANEYWLLAHWCIVASQWHFEELIYCTTAPISDCQLEIIWGNLQGQGKLGFSLFSIFWRYGQWPVMSSDQIDGCSATITCHFWTDMDHLMVGGLSRRCNLQH